MNQLGTWIIGLATFGAMSWVVYGLAHSPESIAARSEAKQQAAVMAEQGSENEWLAYGGAKGTAQAVNPQQQVAEAPTSEVPPLPAELKDGSKAVMLEFYNARCGYCKKMEPTVSKLQKEHSAKLTYRRIDIATPKGQALMDLYQVEGTPTYFVYDGHSKFSGTIPGAAEEELKALVAKAVK